MAELLFKVRTFATLLAKLRRGDVTLTVLASAERATEISRRYDFAAAMAGYCGLIGELARKKPD
jgi:hypothetical protein